MYQPDQRVMMPYEDGLMGKIIRKLEGTGSYRVLADDGRAMDMAEDELATEPVWIAVHAPGYLGAFFIDHRKELIETVEWSGEHPRFDQGGICDLARGGNPDFQQGVRTALESLTNEYRAAA